VTTPARVKNNGAVGCVRATLKVPIDEGENAFCWILFSTSLILLHCVHAYQHKNELAYFKTIHDKDKFSKICTAQTLYDKINK
jgi:hypothetical protein